MQLNHLNSNILILPSVLLWSSRSNALRDCQYITYQRWLFPKDFHVSIMTNIIIMITLMGRISQRIYNKYCPMWTFSLDLTDRYKFICNNVSRYSRDQIILGTSEYFEEYISVHCTLIPQVPMSSFVVLIQKEFSVNSYVSLLVNLAEHDKKNITFVKCTVHFVHILSLSA